MREERELKPLDVKLLSSTIPFDHHPMDTHCKVGEASTPILLLGSGMSCLVVAGLTSLKKSSELLSAEAPWDPAAFAALMEILSLQ